MSTILPSDAARTILERSGFKPRQGQDTRTDVQLGKVGLERTRGGTSSAQTRALGPEADARRRELSNRKPNRQGPPRTRAQKQLGGSKGTPQNQISGRRARVGKGGTRAKRAQAAQSKLMAELVSKFQPADDTQLVNNKLAVATQGAGLGQDDVKRFLENAGSEGFISREFVPENILNIIDQSFGRPVLGVNTEELNPKLKNMLRRVLSTNQTLTQRAEPTPAQQRKAERIARSRK